MHLVCQITVYIWNQYHIVYQLNFNFKKLVSDLLLSYDKTWMLSMYGWTKKVIAWGEISCWRCCASCWNDHKEFRILTLLTGSGRVWENWLQFWKKVCCESNATKQQHIQRNVYERKSQLMCQTSLLSYFRSYHSCLTISNHHPDQSVAINIEARPSTIKKIMTCWKLRWWLAFSAIKYF